MDLQQTTLESVRFDRFALCGVLLAVALVHLLFRSVYNLKMHPLSGFPGPKRFAISKLPLALATLHGNAPRTLKHLHDQYGDVIRVGPSELSFIRPEAWKDVHGHGRTKKFQKYGYTRTAASVDRIMTANDTDHARQRRLLAHAFSEKALREQEPVVMEHVNILMSQLQDICGSQSKVVDLVKWYEWVTFDIIGDLAFGEPFGCLRSKAYHPWVSMLFEVMKAGVYVRLAKEFSPFDKLLLFLFPKADLRKRQDHIRLSADKVQRRLRAKTSRADFWTYVLRHNDERGMSIAEMEANGSTLIIAGSETTASALSGASYHLCKNPRALKDLTEELRSIFQSESDIGMNSVLNLPLLNASLQEALRMYPPLPVGLPRVAPMGGDIVAGYKIPEKTIVSVPQWPANMSKRNFKNPEVFAPERWTGSPVYQEDCREAMQPFSTGPRNCLGKNLAWAEMRVILARVLYSFDLTLQDDTFNPGRQKAFPLWEKPPLHVRLTRAK